MSKKLVKKIVVAVIGTTLVGIGCGMMIKMGLGSSSVTSFYDGFSKVIKSTPGTVSIGVSFLLIIAALIVDKKKVGVATILFMFVSKFPIDITNELFPRPESIIARTLVSFIACFIISIGGATLACSELGATPYDAMVCGINERFNIKYVICRYTCDIFFLISGFITGGAVGIGTIMAVTLLGPIFAKTKAFLVPRLGLEEK